LAWRFATVATPLAGKVLGSAEQSFAVAEWSDAGGAPGARRYIAPWHVHYHDDEGWYVLEGTICVRAGEED
jgi:mannose-6-phosphate isomerase-like protein (cupin superfamily)